MDEINIPGELHAELRELLSAGQRDEAIARLALEQGLSAEVSEQVVDQLQPPTVPAAPEPPVAGPPPAPLQAN